MSLVSHHVGAPARAGNRASALPVISADGRYVAYESQSTDLSSLQDDSNDASDVFRYDRTTGVSTLVSHVPSSPTKSGSGWSSAPSLSADGRYVAFTSLASDLVSGTDANAAHNVFLYDATSGAVTLVSHAPGAPTTAASGYSFHPMVSSDGSSIVFTSAATNLVAGQADANAERDVFLHDRASGTNVLVSHATGLPTTTGNQYSDGTAISADGRFVAYASLASNLAAGQVDSGFGALKLFLFDRTTGASTLITHPAGSPATVSGPDSFDAAISADGRYVAYTSLAGDLVAGQTNPYHTLGVFLYDRTTGGSTLLSRSRAGALVVADADSYHPLLSADGTTIVFASVADDLDPLVLDANNFRDVYLYTRP